MKRKAIILTVLFLAALSLFLQIFGVWNGRGTALTFIAGQFDTGPEITSRMNNVRVDIALTSIPVTVIVDTDTVINKTAPEYLSFSLDTSQIVGGKWWNPKADSREYNSGTVKSVLVDFDNPRLNRLARALTPAYFQIGGSEADKVYYDMKDTTGGAPPEGYESVLSSKRMLQVGNFVKRNGLRFIFTVNSGPSSRNAAGLWKRDNLLSLLTFTRKHAIPVDQWILGNELNAYWWVFGIGQRVSPVNYSRDLKKFRRVVKEYYPEAKVAAQGSIFWPVVGEPLGFFFGCAESCLKEGGRFSDRVLWHYYPQQSRRGIASRKANPSRLLKPYNLDEVKHWGEYMVQLRDTYSTGKEVWLAETGNAQNGGEPGVSDSYIGTLWWLDQLGLLAVHHHQVVIRQTLTGMNYGMIRQDDLRPMPDYWASLLWKKLMGIDVFSVMVTGSSRLRAYAHRGASGTTVLFINLSHNKNCTVSLKGIPAGEGEIFRLGTTNPLGSDIYLNGTPMKLGSGDSLPPLRGEKVLLDKNPTITISPLSMVFIRKKN